jgi:hypothetical protein
MTTDSAQRSKSAAAVTPTKLVAISYARVSTGTQASDDASGLERQELAIAGWLRAHPEYELDREIKHVGSGAKAGRFEWFIDELQRGRLPRGTCLVVEKISRFSREPVTKVLETLIALFNAGGAIAACELGGEVLTDFDGQNGAVFILVGAIQRARGEWEERRDRKLGSDARKRRLIAEGEKPFKARGKGARHASYPFWLDFDERSGQFKTNSHADWVHNIFLWAQEVGAVEIARRLKDRGHRLPTSPKNVISTSRVTTLLRNRAVLGERQHYSKRKPTGDPVPGVYPPIVTTQEWSLAWDAITARNSRMGAVAHTQMHNLFEGRIYCAACMSRIGYGTSRCRLASGEYRRYFYWRCNGRFKDRGSCSAPNRTYDEERLLQRIQTFRWADYFTDVKHDAELAAARSRLLQAQAARADAEREITNIRQSAIQLIRDGKAAMAALAEDDLNRAQGVYSEAIADETSAELALDRLQRRRTGTQAAKAIQDLVAAFMASDRNDIEQRQQFNRWLYAERIVAVYDLSTDVIELGLGTFNQMGELVELDQVKDDAAAFGLDPALFESA